jgi:hypothetical protein
LRIDTPDALLQRWMRGGQPLREPRNAFGKKSVTGCGSAWTSHARTVGQTADLLQRSGNAVRVARELNCGGVGQVFPLPAHRGLDEVAEKRSGKTDGHQAQSERQDAGPTLVVAASAAGERRRAQQEITDDAKHQDAIEYAHQADIEPHIAVEDMAELMGDDALQLLPVQTLDGALSDADHRVARRKAGGEGVDARFIGQQVHRRYRRTRGDGHFLDDVEQLALIQVLRILREQLSAQRLRNNLAAGRQGDHLVEAAGKYHRADAGTDRGECRPVHLPG